MQLKAIFKVQSKSHCTTDLRLRTHLWSPNPRKSQYPSRITSTKGLDKASGTADESNFHNWSSLWFVALRKANVWVVCNRLNRLQGSWKSKHLSCSDASTWTYKMRNTSISFNKKRRFTKKKGIHFSGMSPKSSAMIQMWNAPIGSCDWIFSCQLMALNWG